MPRLLRPHIPLEVRCRVAMRQVGELFPQTRMTIAEELARFYGERRAYGALLSELLAELTRVLTGKDEPTERLHLDHDPMLAVREKLIELPDGKRIRAVLVPKGGTVLRYFPDANDPEFLIYRLADAHDVKTRVRGERGQLSDHALLRREKRRAKKAAATAQSGKAVPTRSRAPAARPLRSANRWPPKGSRPLSGRKPSQS